VSLRNLGSVGTRAGLLAAEQEVTPRNAAVDQEADAERTVADQEAVSVSA